MLSDLRLRDQALAGVRANRSSRGPTITISSFPWCGRRPIRKPARGGRRMQGCWSHPSDTGVCRRDGARFVPLLQNSPIWQPATAGTQSTEPPRAGAKIQALMTAEIARMGVKWHGDGSAPGSGAASGRLLPVLRGGRSSPPKSDRRQEPCSRCRRKQRLGERPCRWQSVARDERPVPCTRRVSPAGVMLELRCRRRMVAIHSCLLPRCAHSIGGGAQRQGAPVEINELRRGQAQRRTACGWADDSGAGPVQSTSGLAGTRLRPKAAQQ